MTVIKGLQNLDEVMKKYGNFLYFDTNDFNTPLGWGKSVEDIAESMKYYVKKHKKLINTPLAYVAIGVNEQESAYVFFYYKKFDKNGKEEKVKNIGLGSYVEYPKKWIEKYGFKTIDLKYIHEALRIDNRLSSPFYSVNIKDIYDTVKKKPKETQDSQKELYPVTAAFKTTMNKIKHTLKKNGRQRFYVPYNFDFPAASSDDIQDAIKQIKKYVKNKPHVTKVFHAMITQKEREIRIKCNEYYTGERLMKTGMGTTVVFDDEYLINYGFRFIDIERIYFALIKNPELSKKKQVSIMDLTNAYVKWSETVCPSQLFF